MKISVRTKRLFWGKVIKYSNGCWLWMGSRDKKGYGKVSIKVQGKWRQQLVHRISWIIHKGRIPKGKCVLHDCPNGDNPACVNPKHLWIGTVVDNNHDMMSKGRFRHHGLKGESCGTNKLTEDQVREIRRLCGLGIPGQQVARQYEVHHSTIYAILSGETWRHVL